MDPYLLANLLCLALCAMPFVGILLWFRQRQRATYADALAAVGSAEVRLEEPTALWVGIDSSGKQTVKGNGVLILTDTELYFRKLLPTSEIRIQRDRIQRIERPDLDAGREQGRLLSVVHRGPDGSERREAWLVEEHAAWLEALR